MTDPNDPYGTPDPNQPPPPPPGYGQPSYGTPPPPGYGEPAYGTPPPYGAPSAQAAFNTLAIVGFVASFCCGPGGIVLGIVARNQIKQRGERGEGLAVAAIAIGALGMLFNVFWLMSR
jgi:hypothetical protein